MAHLKIGNVFFAVYLDTGSSGDPTFSITTSATAGDRTWRIKATFVECGSRLR